MKILIITQCYWPEQFKINDLAVGLKDLGHEITVFTGIPNYPKGSFYENYSLSGPYSETIDGIRIKRSPLIPRGKKKGIQLVLNYLSFFIFGSLIIPFRCQEQYDHIFIYGLSPVTSAIPGVVLRFFKNIPTTFWITDLWPDSLKATGVVKNKYILWCVEQLVKWIYRNTDQLLVSSKSFIPKIHEIYKPKLPIVFWPQWAEDFYFTENFINEEMVKKEIPNGFIVMFAGNIGTSQGFETIIQAAQNLKEYKEIKWVIIGDGLFREKAQKMIEEIGLNNIFFFLGSKPAKMMPTYYLMGDALLVSLKKTELFSMTIPGKLQTCLASGKPVVGSIDGEAAEIIRDSKAGLTGPAGDATALANNVLSLYKMSPEKRNEMGQKGKDYCLNYFLRSKQLSRLEKMMESYL